MKLSVTIVVSVLFFISCWLQLGIVCSIILVLYEWSNAHICWAM